MTYCDYSNQERYPFELPKLPYAKNAFEPCFSAETFEYHHEKHHKAYVDNLNKLLQENKNMMDMDLEQIIIRSYNNNAPIFNNAAQIQSFLLPHWKWYVDYGSSGNRVWIAFY